MRVAAVVAVVLVCEAVQAAAAVVFEKGIV